MTRDQEATRRFYEELLGMPLIATWSEKMDIFGKERSYCHTFFALADGGALAFFQFADEEDMESFDPPKQQRPFDHIALKCDQEYQQQIFEKLQAAGYESPQLMVWEHGYCRSLYVTDPNGLRLEFTVDHACSMAEWEVRRSDAHAVLKRWLAGDHTTNNTPHYMVEKP